MTGSITIILMSAISVTVAQTESLPSEKKRTFYQSPSQMPPVAEEQQTPPTAGDSKDKLTDAEKIVRLIREMEKDKKNLAEIQQKLKDPQGDYAKAETAFKQLDQQWLATQTMIEKLRKEGKSDDADKIAKNSQLLEKQWNAAREQFTLMIEEAKTLREKAATLTKDIADHTLDLNRLKGLAPPAQTPPTAKDPPNQKPAPANGNKGKQDGKKEETPLSVIPKITPPNTKEVKEAKQQALTKEQAAKQAKEKLKTIEQRLESLQQQINIERKLLQNARKEADLAYKEQARTSEEIRRLPQGAPIPEKLAKDAQEADTRANKARTKVRASMDNLSRLQQEQNNVMTEKLAAMREANQSQSDAEKAQKKLADLQNPFAARNVLQWLINRGPAMLIILLVMFLLYRLVHFASFRLVKVMARRKNLSRSQESNEDRARTIMGVFRSVASATILVGGALMLLEQAGIPVVPLLGGAAIIGLAVAFGAQNLVRDYFTGFWILLEDQYGINDLIRIGSIDGKVEKITPRITVLRDLSGVAHFIPHGTITMVSNMSHGFSRAFCEIGVAYKENVDEVMEVMMDVTKELRKDPYFGPLILEDPEMLGVDEFANSAIVIKFYVKTRPIKHLPVRRELLRRIKKKFDELGIEIPFPHRVVFHRHEKEEGASPTNGAAPEKRDKQHH